MQGVPLPITPPKNAGFRVDETRERSPLTKTTSPNGEKQTPRCPRRDGVDGGQLPSKRQHGRDIPKRNHQRGDAMKFCTPTSLHSPLHSQESDSNLIDFSTLSYADASHTNTTTPIRPSRLSRTPLHPQISQQQARGRLGQVVRNFVKRMLPPSSGFTRSASSPRPRQGGVKGACGDSPSVRTCQMTPRSNASGESAWTFASASSWMEAGGQGCATNRWSGFWH